MQFDENALPLDNPGKHRLSAAPKKPVMSHETGNYVTVPRLDLIEQFKDNFKPFWLEPFRAKLEKLGLLAEARAMVAQLGEALLPVAQAEPGGLAQEPLAVRLRVVAAAGLLDRRQWAYTMPIFAPSPFARRPFGSSTPPTVLLLDGLATDYLVSAEASSSSC